MFDRKTLKTRAKFVLARSFFMSFIACLVVTLASSGGIGIGARQLQALDISTMSHIRVAAIFAVIGLLFLAGIAFLLLVSSPLSVGLKYFMLRAADGDTNLENLLYPFKNGYKNIVWVMFVKKLYIFLWSLIGFIPIIVALWKFGLYQKIEELVLAMQNDSVSAALSLSAIMVVVSLLTFIFTIPAIIKELQYSLVEYILADDPYMPRSRAIGKSKEMMVGNKWALVKLIFSFTGWYLAANFTCCIGTLLLNPYIEATFAQMYLEISGQGKDYPGFGYNPNNPFGGFNNM
ncbi:MAG: DUF975 family protein [Clostridia bacterium]|nr:DUF975 family protein [Clostridia bacterium]